MEHTLGEMVTEHNTMLHALHSSLDALTDLLAAQNPQEHTNVIIATPSNFALGQVLDASPHEEQQVSINLLEQLGELFQIFPNTNIRLLWLPRSIPFVAYISTTPLA